MATYRKLGRTSTQRKAMLRNLTTNLLYHGSIQTTETRAKEIRRSAEKLITLAVKEKDNFEEVTVKAKVARKDADGKRVKEEVNGKRVTIFDEVEKTIKKDNPSRLNARRKILAELYSVTEVPADGRKKRQNTVEVDMAKKMFEEIAPKYAGRNGG
ncbi:MAG: 50S ribosomal protein L17, partial [Defluviitaleaceae bacterium]|nr:50S ribosomal protein L17 [Defluviitaleaceae bacterium]